MLWQGRSEDQFRACHVTAWASHPGQFAEDLLAKRIEVKEAIDERDVNG